MNYDGFDFSFIFLILLENVDIYNEIILSIQKLKKLNIVHILWNILNENIFYECFMYELMI